MPINNDRLIALRKREAALRDAIALEEVRQHKRGEKEDARMFSIIGAALVRNATLHPDYEAMLKSILKSTASFTDADTKLLRTKGWL